MDMDMDMRMDMHTAPHYLVEILGSHDRNTHPRDGALPPQAMDRRPNPLYQRDE